MVDGDERRGAGRGATAGFTHRPSPIRPDLSSMTLHAISAVLTNRYDQCRPARLRLRHFARSDPRPCAGAPGCRSGSRSIPAPTWSELDRMIDRIAARLQRDGFAKGDR